MLLYFYASGAVIEQLSISSKERKHQNLLEDIGFYWAGFVVYRVEDLAHNLNIERYHVSHKKDTL